MRNEVEGVLAKLSWSQSHRVRDRAIVAGKLLRLEVKTHGKGEQAVHGVFCGECCVHHAHEPEDNGEEELWLEQVTTCRNSHIFQGC